MVEPPVALVAMAGIAIVSVCAAARTIAGALAGASGAFCTMTGVPELGVEYAAAQPIPF
jgi:hypothetical protein